MLSRGVKMLLSLCLLSTKRMFFAKHLKIESTFIVDLKIPQQNHGFTTSATHELGSALLPIDASTQSRAKELFLKAVSERLKIVRKNNNFVQSTIILSAVEPANLHRRKLIMNLCNDKKLKMMLRTCERRLLSHSNGLKHSKKTFVMKTLAPSVQHLKEWCNNDEKLLLEEHGPAQLLSKLCHKHT